MFPFDGLSPGKSLDIRVDESRLRLGNQEAFDLMDMMETKFKKLEASVEESKRDIDTLKQKVELHEEDRIRLRRRALEDRRVAYRIADGDRSKTTIPRDMQAVGAGDRIAHGGCISGDVAAIRQAQEKKSPHTDQYKADFHQAYGVLFDDVSDQISKYPRQLRAMLDIQASIRDLKLWGLPRASDSREIIQESLDEMMAAVNAVKTLEELHPLFDQGGVLEEKFQAMERRFDKQE